MNGQEKTLHCSCWLPVKRRADRRSCPVAMISSCSPLISDWEMRELKESRERKGRCLSLCSVAGSSRNQSITSLPHKWRGLPLLMAMRHEPVEKPVK